MTGQWVRESGPSGCGLASSTALISRSVSSIMRLKIRLGAGLTEVTTDTTDTTYRN